MVSVSHAESGSAGGINASANVLLRELRDVARSLPKGLDEVALGQELLSQLQELASCDAAVLCGVGEENRPAPIAASGISSTLPAARDDLYQQAIASRTVATGDESDRYRAILPLLVGDQFVGSFWLERRGHDWTNRELQELLEVRAGIALQLDSARLFSEVREIATLEERHRLAREIHDGIAQEIASLGYSIDALVATASTSEQKDDLATLRQEVSRIVSELRLSIFDLRSDVGTDAGLGAALSTYVRQVGAATDLTVHLVLDEAAARLNQAIEMELLRIAQEAITNVRRHALASNLWVTCRIHPPAVFLRIADDGRGLGSPRIDSYGLEIMQERASRIGVSIELRERRGGGTIIDVHTPVVNRPAATNEQENPWPSTF